MSTAKSAPLTFEAGLQKLEEQVRALEAGNLSLDDALTCFEEGTKLARLCEARLTEAKGKVEALLKDADGAVRRADFEAGA